MKPIQAVILGLLTAGIGLYIYDKQRNKQKTNSIKDKAIGGFIEGYISPNATQSDIIFKEYGEITNDIHQKMSQECKKIQNLHREQRKSIGIGNVQEVSY